MEIETDKTAVAVPAPFNGVVEEIMVKDGDTVKSGQPLFKFKKSEGGATPSAAAAAPAPAAPQAAKPPPAAAAAAPPPSPPKAAPQAQPPPPPQRPAAPSAQIPVAAIRHAQGIEAAVKVHNSVKTKLLMCIKRPIKTI